MKRPWTIAFFALLSSVACDSGGNITEVGNPTTQMPTSAQAADGITKAFDSGVAGTLPVVGASFSVKSLKQEGREEETSTDENEFSCRFDESTRISTCNCPSGGTSSYSFTDRFSESGDTLTFNQTFTEEMTNCVVETCNASVPFTGRMTGTLTGTYNTGARQGNLTAEYRTETDCSGMRAGDVEMGFAMTFQDQEGTKTFSGLVCIDGTSYSFTSIEELLAILDPDGTCERISE